MKTRITRGKPGPKELDIDKVLQLIEQGVVTITLKEGNPPRPELVVNLDIEL